MKNPAEITLRDVNFVANKFIKTFHPSLSIPVPIEDIVEIKLNMRIVLIQGLIRNFGVNAFITQSFDSIVIDENMYSKQPERIRFTIAEETGHLFLHSDWYSQNGPKSMTDYIQWQERIDINLYRFIERQAKTFAGLILIPTARLDEKWKVFCQKYNISSPCSVYDLPDTFPELSHDFGVSSESMLVRLSFTKLVTVPDGFWRKVRK